VLTVYRRHKEKCKFADDRVSRKCRCSLWATGTFDGGPYRKSLKTRSFERAQQIIREIEDGNRKKEAPKIVTVKHALDAFFADCESRNLNESTVSKYRLLRTLLQGYADGRNVSDIRDFGRERALDFRNAWTGSPRTLSKRLERLRAFFNFCVENDWITKNPAKSIKPPQTRPIPTLPFTDGEVARILAKADFRSGVFFRALLHSGLRIIDVAGLRPERIQDGKLFLYQQKTGVPVWIPLPPDLVADLRTLKPVGGMYFATESDYPASIAEYYRQKLFKAAIEAGLMQKRKKGEPRRKNPIHPHRFRDTFAVRLLEKGVPLETVSVLLGHTDIKTTQRSYAPWVKSLQDNLELAVQKTWEQPKLVRVK
jgi:integrase